MSEFARGSLYLIRVRTPGGDAAELDCEPCADFARATNLALRLAMKLAQPDEGHPFGLPEAVLDLQGTLGALGAEPLGCTVEVVTQAAPSALAPNGWRVLRTERVRAYQHLPPPTVVPAAVVRW